MPKPSPLTLALCFAAGMAGAQNTAARPTPQTQNAAPAAISGAISNGQPSGPGGARNSVTGPTGSMSAPATTGANRNGNAPRTGSGRSGGGSAARGSSAPAATDRVVVTGDADGNGVPEKSAVLPGLSLQHNALGVATGAPIQVRLQQPVDSGHAKNGDTVRGVLAAPLGRLPAGAPVQLTVVAAAPAGQLSSRGELSLQVVSVNGQQLLSDVITAEGKEGAKILADDAPKPGTEAIFTPDQTITLPAS